MVEDYRFSGVGADRDDKRISTHSKDAFASSEDHESARVPAGASALVASAQDTLESVKQGARTMAHDATDNLSKGIEAGGKYAREGADSLGQQVKQQPVAALLCAGIIGLLVGIAIGR